MRVLNPVVLVGFSILTVTARADRPLPRQALPDPQTLEEGAETRAPAAGGSVLQQRRDLIAAAKRSSAPMVQDHLRVGIEKVGENGLLRMDAEWFTNLKVKMNAARTRAGAAAVDPALAGPVEAGTCPGGPDCPLRDKDKDQAPIALTQREPIERITERLPPPPTPVAPVVPAPAPPAFSINQDVLLGGVFGLLGGVLLTSMLNKNKQRPFFPYQGMPMPMRGFPFGHRGVGFGGVGGGFGGRLGAPIVAGPAQYGGQLGAPAMLPPIYSAPQYSIYGGTNVGVNSVSMFGSQPVSTSPLLGGAPAWMPLR